MALPVLQFAGMPGGPELLVIGLIFLLLFGVPLAVIVVVGVLWIRSNESGAGSDSDGTEARVEELEAEIRALREQLDAAIDDQTDTRGERRIEDGGEDPGDGTE